MSLCPEHDMRAAMSDAEFWEHVFGRAHDEESWADYWDAMSPDIWAINCARCGRTVEIDDPEGRECDAFCDDCATETLPYEEPAQ